MNFVKTAPETKSNTSLPPHPEKKNGSLSEFLQVSIHFSQSNGLWRSDWFYSELNNPKPVELLELHCVYVNTIKSPPQMSTWFNLFHSGRQLNWISPKWLSISCLCVTSGYGCRGIQTHSLIHLTPILHLAQSKRLHILHNLKKKKEKT